MGPRLLLFSLGLVLGAGCRPDWFPKTQIETASLSNGLQVVLIRFPGSTNVSMFSFLTMGLTGDGPGQAQWAHLVEHLVIRTTIPGDLKQANAETLPDHMRLDFYGNTNNWRDGLSHHRRWLEGLPFTEASLAVEKPRVVSECDFTARTLGTHKFALAAWAQGWRHGRSAITLKGDVLQAKLAEVQSYRDQRLAVPGRTTFCVVGGLDPAAALAEIQQQLGSLRLTGTPPGPTGSLPARLDLTWDLAARHLILAWPIPEFGEPDYPALMAIAQWLNQQYATQPELKRMTGLAFAGADLATPEGRFFYLSASLKQGVEFEAVQHALLAPLAGLSGRSGQPGQIPMIGRQVAWSLTQIPLPPASFPRDLPPGVTPAVFEANRGLGFAMSMHRFGPLRPAVAERLNRLTPAAVQQASERHLSKAKVSVCTIQPAGPAAN